MCGLNAIYAYHDAAPSVRREEVIATRDHMAARGPDGAGLWVEDDERIGLGHRRLSIIDPNARAGQPMVSGCGRFILTYNGEIYNYSGLREELLAEGVPMRTTSDTEVILELFARDGVGALPRLTGMFALAIWDMRDRVLWLARDTYGIKPLYYADDGRTVRAASQVKALLAGGSVSRDPDPAGIAGFFIWGSVPEPFTIHREVRAVPAGHVVRVDANGPGLPQPFLALEDVYAEVGDADAPMDAVVREAVLASLRRHLVADVPVGLFLSAGIDSTALLAGLHALDPALAAETETVTIGFREYQGQLDDEVPLAALMARRFGARHRTRMVGDAEFQDDLPRIFAAMDQPSIDGVNAWFVAKAASEAGLKVALSGLGGDELFGGYPSFQRLPRWVSRMAFMARVPGLRSAWRRTAQVAGKLLPELSPKFQGLVTHGGAWDGAYLLLRGLFLPEELVEVMDRETLRTGLERLKREATVSRLVAMAPSASTARVSLLESALYMRNQLLRDADWASMAHSLEVRTPFVDKDLLRALRPYQERMDGKATLARAMNLPDAVALRSKTGFTTPVREWTRTTGHNPAKAEPWARRWARSVAATEI